MELIESGVVPWGTDYNLMDTRFNRGEVATMISGLGVAQPGAQQRRLRRGAAAPGRRRARPPMFGVTAAMINSATPNDFLAVEFENYLSVKRVQLHQRWFAACCPGQPSRAGG